MVYGWKKKERGVNQSKDCASEIAMESTVALYFYSKHALNALNAASKSICSKMQSLAIIMYQPMTEKVLYRDR